jgi:hypothetical protein
MNDPSGISTRATVRSASASELIYELLDAHADTADLASELSLDLDWRVHLRYLSDLQRVGRETLAHMSTEPIQ